MYLIGQGHEHLGPGTSMVQRINMTQDQADQMMGLGCACEKGLGCACDSPGMFDFNCMGDCNDLANFNGLTGLGLFDGGFDTSTWGWPEWSIVALGGYMVMSTVFTTGRAVRGIRAIPGERRKAKAARLRARAKALTAKR